MVLSSVLIPFNQTYQTVMSPLVVILLPLLLFTHFLPRRPVFLKRLLMLAVLGGALWCFWNYAVKTPYYVSHYSHFSDLTAAKLKFNNVKPQNPDKLTYNARMMWTPAMHSADWKILATYFPSIGTVTGARFIVSLFYLLLLGTPFFRGSAGMVRRNLPRLLFPLTFTVVFTVGFIYIVRYHEFLILFLALSLPLLLDDLQRALRLALRRNPEKKTRRLLKTVSGLLTVCCLLLLGLEILVSLCGRRVYDNDVRMRETCTSAAVRSGTHTASGADLPESAVSRQ